MKTPKDIIEADLGEAPDDWRSNPDYKVDLNTAENWMIQYAEQFHPKVIRKEFPSGIDFKELINFVIQSTATIEDENDPFAEELWLKHKTIVKIEIYEND
jgi:hypothetical protein